MFKKKQAPNPDEEVFKPYLYNPYCVDVIFPEGSIYLTLSKSIYGTPIVQMFRQTPSKHPGPAEASGAIELGDMVIQVNGDDTYLLSYAEFMLKTKEAPRPMTFRFVKPEKDSKLHQPIRDHPGKMMEWKRGLDHLPIKIIDLTKFPLEEEKKRRKGKSLNDIVCKYQPKAGSNTAYAQRVKEFQKALTSPVPSGLIFMDRIRELSFFGIPDEKHLRAVYWKILLGFYGLVPDKWSEEKENHQKTYNDFVKMFIQEPNEKCGNEGSIKVANPLEMTWIKREVDGGVGDDGGDGDELTKIPAEERQKILDSKWNELYGDQELREDIWKDVNRTHADMAFFGENVRDIIARILFVYAKLNPGVKYVQGMNEVLAPLYIVFSAEPNEDETEAGAEESELNKDAEFTTFFCFSQLMSEIKDLFNPELDDTHLGVQGYLSALTDLIERYANESYKILKEQNIEVQLFAIRWITTFLSREFMMPDVQRIWDSLLSDPQRFTFLLHICTAMVLLVTDQLKGHDFSDNLKLLQRYPPIDISEVLQTAYKIRDSELKKEFLTEDGQIDLASSFHNSKGSFGSFHE